jgi:hypothetical protein
MLELEHGFRVVDVHTRLDPDEEAVAVRGRQVSPERLEREMHQAGVERAAASPGRTPDGEGYLRANNAVARLSVDRPLLAFGRLGGPRRVNRVVGPLVNAVARPKSHHTTAGDVEQYAYDDRYHGFTLDPAHDGLPTESVLDELGSVGDPVLVHGGEDCPPDAVAETLLGRGFPVVLTSFGGYPLNEELMTSALRRSTPTSASWGSSRSTCRRTPCAARSRRTPREWFPACCRTSEKPPTSPAPQISPSTTSYTAPSTMP